MVVVGVVNVIGIGGVVVWDMVVWDSVSEMVGANLITGCVPVMDWGVCVE